MGYKLLLDSREDLSEFNLEEDAWVRVKDVKSFEKIITTNYLELDEFPETISFVFNLGFDILDHKINPKVETGIDAFRWLVEFCKHYKLSLPECIVHADGQQAADFKTIIRNTKNIYNI